MQPGDVAETRADIDDLVRDLGFRPSTSLELGVKSFVAWYRQYYGPAGAGTNVSDEIGLSQPSRRGAHLRPMDKNSVNSSGFTVHEIVEPLRIVSDRLRPVLQPTLEAEVEAHWERAVQVNPALFNGAVFSADVITPSWVGGHMTEFRRVIAQIRDPVLYSRLSLRPVSISGLLICPETPGSGSRSIILGRRSADSIFQPSIWQLAPAGSIDDGALKDSGEVDWSAQIAYELQEELGVVAENIEKNAAALHYRISAIPFLGDWCFVVMQA